MNEFVINFGQTGQPTIGIQVSPGTTIQDVLDMKGLGDTDSVTVNGIRTSDLEQPLAAGATIFVTREHKAGK